ncbi:MAG: hypothetical protein R2791_11375 [Saprospiraceae bacterium]
MNHICTWIYLDSPEESSEYPQVGKKSHLAEFQKVYWKCVAVFFACSTRTNPNSRHLLFTNKRQEALPEVEGLDLKSYLSSLNVEVITLPLRWQTPEGYFGKWRNQFYIFDILQFIENQHVTQPGAALSDENYVILDSDCIVNRPLDGLFAEINRSGLLTLPMPYSDTHDINGVTREEMRRIYAELDGNDPGDNPVYYGGEIFAASLDTVRKINRIAPKVWETMMQRFREGKPRLNEEAHFLSYCYHKIGNFGSLEPYIKRIWTAPQYSNVAQDDARLPIWHLPSEKTGGIALIFEKLKTRNWSMDDLGGYLGVPGRTKYLDWKHRLRYTKLYKWLKR